MKSGGRAKFSGSSGTTADASDTCAGAESSDLLFLISGTYRPRALLAVEVRMFRWLFGKLTDSEGDETVSVAPLESLVDRSALADFVRLLRKAETDETDDGKESPSLE
jgi:hypothetical protein